MQFDMENVEFAESDLVPLEKCLESHLLLIEQPTQLAIDPRNLIQ